MDLGYNDLWMVDVRLDIEKCSARKMRLRGIVSHCMWANVSSAGDVKEARGRTQIKETAVVMLSKGTRSIRRPDDRIW